jgi:Fe-S-cluster containining protein
MVRVLSFHASYVCQEQGACCTSDWPIEIEAEPLDRACRAMRSGHLGGSPETCFEPVDVTHDAGPTLLVRRDNRCVFLSRRERHRCDLHHALGHSALPLACRQFPRVSLLHPGGASVTLSHFCPTAAALLVGPPGAIRIVSDAARFPAAAEYVGLDARSALPPLLRPDMLMDWEAWYRWEELSIAVIDEATSPHAALCRLGQVVEVARTWRPGDGALVRHLERAFESEPARGEGTAPGAAERSADGVPGANANSSRHAEVLASIPEPLRPNGLITATSAAPLIAQRRLLAAHAFASWAACLGGGLRTWLRSLEAVQALIDSGLPVREVDLWLRHLADPTRLARAWAQVERPEQSGRRKPYFLSSTSSPAGSKSPR